MPGLELYYIAFNDLMASRTMGMTVGPIWWDTIQTYCEAKELSEDQIDSTHSHVKAMDLAYMKFLSKKK